MRRMTLWCAGAVTALSLTAVAGAADLILTGNVAGGTYTRSNEDVYIYDATVVPGAGGVTTLTIIVHNGKIVVGSAPSISGNWGIDASGPDGADGWSFVPPQAGQPGRAGYNVVLKTDSLMSSGAAARERSIYVGKPVDCSGGAGGDGAHGEGGHFVDCAYVAAQDGTTARSGANGGNITISAAGSVFITGSLDTSGGAGGQGGSGGSGSKGAGGTGQPGGNGGNAGSVTVQNSSVAPAASVVSLYVNHLATGWIAAAGGPGGGGGAGGTGHGPHAGGNAGNGGTGGPVLITCRNFAMAAPLGTCSIYTDGGAGGTGGAGGAGSDSACIKLDCPAGDVEYPVDGYPGADSGLGGDGGAAGLITITGANQFSVGANCGLSARGGHGASSGIAGAGGVETGNMCAGGAECEDFSAYGPGQTSASGDGGAGGPITVGCATLSLSVQSALDSSGGDGGDGVDSELPGIYCCGDPEVSIGGHGGQGGQGGAGGHGGDIKLTYTTYLVSNEPYWYCGGQGYQGGDGSDGQPPGPGGVGGACGQPGTLYKNGAAQPGVCDPPCGAVTGAAGGDVVGDCGISG